MAEDGHGGRAFGTLTARRAPCYPESMSCRIAPASGFIKEPNTSFSVVDECLEKTGRRNIVVFVAEIVGFAQCRDHALIVLAQLCQHVLRIDISCVIVAQTLMTPDIADGSQCSPAKLAHAFGEHIGRGEYLVCVLVEQQMIIAEMRPTDVPVKILGLHVKREGIG